MTPDRPTLTPEQQEYVDQQEQAYMNRRTAMEAYGEQMAKMFAKEGEWDNCLLLTRRRMGQY